MGACTNLSKGRGIHCTRSIGGVKTVYLVNFEYVSNLTVVNRFVFIVKEKGEPKPTPIKKI